MFNNLSTAKRKQQVEDIEQGAKYLRQNKFRNTKKIKTMDSKPSVNKLGETIHSLLGFKAHLTSAWVKSVCDIVKSLPSQKPSTDARLKELETRKPVNNIDGDSETAIKEIKGMLFITVYLI